MPSRGCDSLSSKLQTCNCHPEQAKAGSGSATFNIFRNIGGSFGIAILSTLVTRREQFHDLRIGELVTAYSPSTQARLSTLQGNFVQKGFDAETALTQSYAVIKSLVNREAFVMACNDAFLVAQ